jgi:SAM-dependent methyltransferase/uncharacterized protein YbaR (Trm112 family)
MVPMICPITREPLQSVGDGELVAPRSGNRYPVVSGIPILLPDPQERERIVKTNWDAAGGENGGDAGGAGDGGAAASALSFYNKTAHNVDHRRDQDERAVIERALAQVAPAAAGAAVLEIGTGAGRFQGTGGDDRYVALDYGFTALRDYLDPRYQRVCGTAEALPFPDASFGFVFTLDALEHVPRADLAFAEIDRVLGPGGVALVAPAWHCRQYVCDGVLVLPYHELSFAKKLTKATLPIRESAPMRAATMIPPRVLRRFAWIAGGRKPTRLKYRRLRANYERPLCSDSDACSSIDSHEGSLFFASRGYDVLSPGPAASQQILGRHVRLTVRKPA